MVALIGAGASADAGLPDWKGLCGKVLKFATEKASAHREEFKRLFETNQYLELFEIVEDRVGREVLVKFLAENLKPIRTESEIHKIVASYPFAFYLTTNYDDLIKDTLAKAGYQFTKLYNAPEDVAAIDANTSGVVVKLHGDFAGEKGLILTTSDFAKLAHDPTYESFRKKFEAVLHMYDILAVGYSFKDPHLTWILEKLAVIFRSARPIYAILSDAEPGEVLRYRRQYSVEVISYKTVNGSHERLHQLLKSYEPYILQRTPKAVDYATPEPKQVEDANQLFLFTTFHVKPEAVDFKLGAYKALVVSILAKEGKPLKRKDLLDRMPLNIAQIADKAAPLVEISFKRLQEEGAVKTLLDGSVELSSSGQEGVLGSKKKFEIARDNFSAQVSSDFSVAMVGAGEDAKKKFLEETIACANQIFYLRGVEIAGSIFDSKQVSMVGGYDILRVINYHATKFTDQAHSLLFMTYVQRLISTPNATQQEFLWHLSQAYFSYHALNLDPSCSRIQKELLAKNLFVVDSNVVIPLLAEGTFQHSAAKELFFLASELKTKICITKKVVREVIRHARFAAAVALREGADSAAFLEASLGRGGFRQNLFIDGFIRLSQSISMTFPEYLDRVLGSDDPKRWEAFVETALKKANIHLIDPERLFASDDIAKVEQSFEAIRKYRLQRGSYREDDQCHAEAEIDHLINLARTGGKIELEVFTGVESVKFISQSKLLDNLDRESREDRKVARVWRPETYFRYLSCFSRAVPSKDLWQQFVSSDIYQAGVPIVDEAKYKKFFSGAIRQAGMDFETQKRTLERIGAVAFAEKATAEFDETAEFERPMFVESLEMHLERLIAGAKVITKKEREELTEFRAKEKARREFIKKQQRRAAAAKRS